jgi:hypothetical protein
MGARRIRREQRQVDQADSRARNGVRKVKEQARRDARILEMIQQGKMPYGPHVMSWLSLKLDKPTTRITQEDVDRIVRERTKA